MVTKILHKIKFKGEKPWEDPSHSSPASGPTYP